MSRSEERKRMKDEDYASIRRGRESASRSPSRSRSRSRDRGRKSRKVRDPRGRQSRSQSPTTDSMKRERSKSLSRSDSRWESPSNTPPNTTTDSNPNSLKQELQTLQSIPTTALSTANPQTQPITHQSIAAIVDSVLPQHPPLHAQPPPTHLPQQTQQPQPPMQIQQPEVQPEVQPPPQHIQYNIDEGTLRKFCQPYNMEELVKMICNTAYVNKEFYEILVNEMKRSSKWCKLFVHGLPWTTTQETLYNVFSRFGQIQECVILKDRNGQSKGYGFINYNNATEAMNAINAGPQQIDGRMVGSDLAWKGRKNRGNGGAKDYSSQSHGSNGRGGGGNRGQSYPMAQQSHGAHRGGMGVSGNPLQARIVNTVTGGNGLGGPLAMRRLFVYSLLYTTDDATLHNQFSQYGELEEAVIIKDKTNDMKSKGYGFVIFKNVRDAQKALQQPHKMIDGRTVHCSLAIDGQNKGGHGGNDRGGGHQQHRGGHAGAAMAAAAAGHPGVGGSGLSALSGLIAQQQAQLAAHPTLNALNTILQAQQQQAALQSYADPYQNVLYQAALGGSAPNAASGAGAGTTQLLQQLLAQQQQLLQSQANGAEDGKKSAPAPINPNGY